MQIDPQATIEGVPLTVIRKMFRRDGLKGTLTAEFVRGTLHVSESGAAALLRASVTVGFLRRERAGLRHLTTAGIHLREATAAKPLIRRTAERLLEDLLQRMTALNEDPRFLARGEKAIVFDCYLDAGDLGKPRHALKRRTTQNRRSQHLIYHVFGWGSGFIGSGMDETSSSRRALRIESNVCTCYSIYGVKHLTISNMLWVTCQVEERVSRKMASRSSHRYILRDGRTIVQFGITNGAIDRAMEHLRSGKRFTTMTVIGPAVTRDTALDWERDRIEGYQRTHDGKRPRYNKM